MKTLRYSSVKDTPKVPLILLTVEKIEHEYFNFVLLSFFFHFQSELLIIRSVLLRDHYYL